MKFHLFSKTNTACRLEDNIPKVIYSPDRMSWECFWSAQIEKLAKADGKIDETVWGSKRLTFTFQQDSKAKYRTSSTTEWLWSKYFYVLCWPTGYKSSIGSLE